MEYKIELDIDVKKKEFMSLINLKYSVEEDIKEFLIHKNTVIEGITINGSQAEWDIEDVDMAFIPEAKKLILKYSKVSNEPEIIIFSIKGSIDIIKYDINQISDKYIELNLYSPWYPVATDLRKAKADIDIYGIDDFYLLKGNKKSNGTWNLSFEELDFYIIAFLSPWIKEIKFEYGVVNLIGRKENKVIPIIEDGIRDILGFYNNIFKKVVDVNLDIVIAPREKGSGYCRENLIVMTEARLSKEKYERFLAHELSHLWFIGAEVLSWEDWLNESFAEYISLLYIEKKYGRSTYEEAINKLREYTKKCPPIKDSDRNSEEGSKIRYKGTILLHEMRELFGLDSMYEVFNILIQLNEKKTEGLIVELKKFNPKLGIFLEDKIKH